MKNPGEFNIPDPSSLIPQRDKLTAQMSDALKDIKTPFNAGGELVAEALKKYVRRLEMHLDDDQALVLESYQGGTPMRVTQVAFPSGRTLVLIGVDANGNTTHLFSHVSAVQLDIKIVPKEPDEERTRIGFHHFMDEDES